MRQFFYSASHYIIEYSFYLLLFVVPLSFTSITSELFEFNKMWVTYGLTCIIIAAWITKMIAIQEVRIQRTPLDIPIAIFLVVHIIATINSLDSHISVWGYYSRFNGGLLSILSYILLYYAFVSNFLEITPENDGKNHKKKSLPTLPIFLTGQQLVRRMIIIALLSSVIVALWGFPSHFGYDPTCYLFRGTFDVSCWTEAFQPKVRIFSTMGQPNWMAAYLAIFIPIIIGFIVQKFKTDHESQSHQKSTKLVTIKRFEKGGWRYILYLLLLILFYFDLLYTGSQSGFLGLWMGLIFFVVLYGLIQIFSADSSLKNALLEQKYITVIASILLIFAGIAFFQGQPIQQLNKFTYSELKARFAAKNQITKPAPKPSTQLPFAGELGGTDSGKIRLLVWRGALEIWRHNPIFGTGVETFAFAYYQHRPAGHNLTSEWDYLYNKAHNEYLNYLATTGIVGLISYIAITVVFLYVSMNTLARSHRHTPYVWIIVGLMSGYVSILITNFLGFSVVITNIFLFLIPAFVFVMGNSLSSHSTILPVKKMHPHTLSSSFSLFSQAGILGVWLVCVYFLYSLIIFWAADTAYAYGSNLDRAGQYQLAYPYLQEAVTKRSSEPVFQDELSYNEAVLATALATQKEATTAATLAADAIARSNAVVTNHPNNIVFWKTRVRLFYALSQSNPEYLKFALEAIDKAYQLAPTDAKVAYNLAVLHGQTGNPQKAVEILNKTVILKPDYQDAYYALGLFYHDLAIDKNGNVVKPELEAKAVEAMHYILKNISPNDKTATEILEKWGASVPKN